MTIHSDFAKVKHLAAVQEALRAYKAVYAQGGQALKDAEEHLNRVVEQAVSPKGRPLKWL